MTARRPRAASSSCLIALLRAINVGGHTVRMEELRRLFDGMGLTGSETFIASGNVIFQSSATNVAALETKIEKALATALGYEVATFIRTPAELAAVAAHEPFAGSEIELPGVVPYIGFLRTAPTADAREKLLRLRSAINDFHVHGREFYWLARAGMGESKITGGMLERALGMRTTMRNVNTVRKLAVKYAGKGD